MITRLVGTPITSYICIYVFVVETFTIYSFRTFQVSNITLLTTVTVLNTKLTDLTHLLTRSLHSFTTSPHSPHPPAPVSVRPFFLSTSEQICYASTSQKHGCFLFSFHLLVPCLSLSKLLPPCLVARIKVTFFPIHQATKVVDEV